MSAHASDTLARKLMVNSEEDHKLNFPNDKTEVYPQERKKKVSEYIGVFYNEKNKKWTATRRSKREKKSLSNGTYRNEEKTAHASDNLARKLLANGEEGHKLNFPDDNTEVYADKGKSSNYFGLTYIERPRNPWVVRRYSKNEKKFLKGGSYRDEETAAHASDTLARELMANGEQHHKLNFPDDDTEVYPEEKIGNCKYIGVSYIEKYKKWFAQRYSKNEKKVFNNGSYRDEETAARSSDSLARKLMANGEKGHKINFPDSTEVHKKATYSKYFGVSYNKETKRWVAQRWSQMEEKHLINGANHRDEETAARASDTLARKLMANGKQGHKLNFPADETKEHPQQQTNKRKRSFEFE